MRDLYESKINKIIENQKIIARAILVISRDGCRMWDYDGEQCFGEGILLDEETFRCLSEIG